MVQFFLKEILCMEIIEKQALQFQSEEQEKTQTKGERGNKELGAYEL